jgi:putative oxidoreductase
VYSSTATDAGLLAVRLWLGFVMVAHGYNHVFGGGRIAGTARWFDSLGMRPGRLHAWLASLTELGCGLILIAGFLTPVAAAGIVGTMLVALVTNHLRNGFFIFRPGEGYEYVLTLVVAAAALGAIGPGRWSVDNWLGVWTPPGWSGASVALLGGALGASVLLCVFWRPSA